MPNRILREGILSSEKVCSLKWAAEVFYRRLMSIVDDYGRCEANAALLRARLYPLQVDKVCKTDIEKWILETVEAGLCKSYCVQGKEYLQVENFGQKTRTPSKHPPPDGNTCKHLSANDNKENQMSANDLLGVSVFVSGVDKEISPSGDTKKDSAELSLTIAPDADEVALVRPKTPKNEAERRSYSERVKLAVVEYDKLVSECGQGFADKCIARLDAYKGASGKRYKSDYLAIRSWVISAVTKDESEQKKMTTQERRLSPYAL